MIGYILLGIVAVFVGVVIGLLVERQRTVGVRTMLSVKGETVARLLEQVAKSEQREAELATALSQTKDELSEAEAKVQVLAREAEMLKTSMSEREESRTKEFDAQLKMVREQMENATRELLEAKARSLTTANKESIEAILKPYHNNLDEMRKEIDRARKENNDNTASLRENISMVMNQAKSVGDEARRLSRALKSDSKVQGDWGEMVLRRILEVSGLKEGVNYKLQATTNDDGSKIVGEDGNRLRPDAVFYLPDDKSIVIDSKVSLKAYVEYVNSADDAVRAESLRLHIASVERHIDELAGKRYDDFVQNAADFVMMFIPNEGAYICAMQNDDKLWERAYNKRIIIVSPTHLLSTMKLMYQLWSRDKQTKNALSIAEETAKLYDKLASFVTDLNGVGDALNNASKKYVDAKKKLAEGSGNVLSRFEKIRRVGGLKTSKQLPMVEETDIDE